MPFHIVQKSTPNKRTGRHKKRAIMLHHTASASFSGTVRWFMNKKSGVSAHFVVGKRGEIAKFVPMKDVAFHAGQGRALRKPAVIPADKGNDYCIGIEIVNRGNGKDPYPNVQLRALDWLIAHIDEAQGKELPIIDHKFYAPDRKSDMSKNFPLTTYQKYRCHTKPVKKQAETVQRDITRTNLYKVAVRLGPLNVRKSPSLTAKVVGKLAKGTAVMVDGTHGKFSHIRTGKVTGWVAAKYLKKA